MLNHFTDYELDTWSQALNSDFTLKDCLFGGVKLTKNADPDKYVYIAILAKIYETNFSVGVKNI